MVIPMLPTFLCQCLRTILCMRLSRPSERASASSGLGPIPGMGRPLPYLIGIIFCLRGNVRTGLRGCKEGLMSLLIGLRAPPLSGTPSDLGASPLYNAWESPS